MWFYISIFLIIVILLIFYILRIYKDKKLLETVTKVYRGTRSERNVVLKLLKNGILAKNIFHDLYIENNGQYSQIDLVVTTNKGIFIFEIKDYSGWLFGKGNQKQWTQVLAYGREKYRFYNPVMQNNGHIRALQKKLRQIDHLPFYSIIVFYGNCELKDVSLIPNGTFITYSNGFLDIVKKIMNNNLQEEFEDKWGVLNVLTEAVYNGDNIEVIQKHIENVKNIKDNI